MKILIAAGGSGGHIFPAVALKRALSSHNDVVMKFVGSDKAIDRRIFEKEGSDFSLLSSNKLPYKISLSFIIFFLRLVSDMLRSIGIVTAYRPACCVGFGGYVSFPVIFAAKLFCIRTVVHEQNVIPGRANKILFGLADKIALSFEDTLEHLSPSERRKAVVTGNPIRTDDFRDDRLTALKSFGLEASKFTVLVVGGSQGAHVLNDRFISSVGAMDIDVRSKIQIIHLTGVKDYERAVEEYGKISGIEARAYSFIDRIEDAYSAADLIITRAGASALFEAAYFGKAMIVVPYPYAMSHQVENARAFSGRGGAVEISEDDLSKEFFKDAIEGFLNDRSKLLKLGEAAKKLSLPDAAAKLAGVIKESEK